MKSTYKRLLLSIALLAVWMTFVLNGGSVSQVVVSALGGWLAGGLIYDAAEKVFPND